MDEHLVYSLSRGKSTSSIKSLYIRQSSLNCGSIFDFCRLLVVGTCFAGRV